MKTDITVDVNTEGGNTFFSNIGNWCAQNWLLLLIILFILFLTIMLIVVPYLRRRKMKRLQKKETQDLKEDLKVWKDIAEITTEREQRDTVKRLLSSRLHAVRTLFAHGLNLLKTSDRKRYDIPWYVMLGEPGSGKSELLWKCGLDMVPSVSSKNEEEAGEPLPVRCWLCSDAFVIDVGGKTFFDCWLGGSGAEMNHLTKLINKAHKRKPINGIILTLPADALLTDSEELTARKSSLFIGELRNMLNRLSSFLPCHVVVTKLDMLPGFSEYFCDLTTEESEAVFGWRNRVINGSFNEISFNGFWKETLNKLHSGVVQVMRGPQVHLNNISDPKGRLNLTCGIYLFPNEFAKLENNLKIYLKNIFGSNTLSSNKYAMLSGVYFTSAKDGHIRISKEIASYAGKEPEDMPVIVNRVPNDKPKFVHDLLGKLIFQDRTNAYFSRTRLISRQMPHYLCCILLLCAAFFFAHPALTDYGKQKANLYPSQQYYEDVARMFKDDVFTKRKIVWINEKTKRLEISEDFLADYGHASSSKFLYQSQYEYTHALSCPVPFWIADYCLFNGTPFGRHDARFIADQIRAQMMFLPLIQQTMKYMSTPEGQAEPLDLKKRDVQCTLVEQKQDEALKVDPNRGQISVPVMPFLYYMGSQSGKQDVSMISQVLPAQKISVLDAKSITASRLFWTVMSTTIPGVWLEKWKALEVYPESDYVKMRTNIHSGIQFLDNRKKLKDLTTKLEMAKNEKTLLQTLTEIHKLSDRQQLLAAELNAAAENAVLATKLPFQNQKKDAKIMINPRVFYNSTAAQKYEKQMRDDYEFLGTAIKLRTDDYSDYEQKIAEANRIVTTTKNAFIIAYAAFQAEKKQLEKQSTVLQQSGICEKLNAGETVTNVTIMLKDAELFAAADLLLQMPTLPELKSVQEFSVQYDSLNKKFQQISKNFEILAMPYVEDPMLGPSIAEYRSLQNASMDAVRHDMLRQLFARYPKSVDAFKSMIAANSKLSPETLGMKTLLAEESFRKMPFQMEYDPEAVSPFLMPISKLMISPQGEAKADKGKKNAAQLGLSVPSDLQSRFHEITVLLAAYLNDYSAYWSHYMDSLEMTFSSWKNFRDYCRSAKPYQINTLLFIGYNATAQFLNDVPDSLFSATTLTENKKNQMMLSARCQILGQQFFNTCNQNIASWANLPEQPDEAYLMLTNMPDNKKNADYFAIIATGAKGDIPWWSKLILTGTNLMAQEAHKELYDRFSQHQEPLFSFPLCINPPYPVSLDETQLRSISKNLAEYGIPVVSTDKKTENKTAAAEKDELNAQAKSSLQNGKLNDPIINTWGTKLQQIIDALVNEKVPMTWQIIIPDRVTQIRFSDAVGLLSPLAMDRFPFVSFQGTNSKQTTPLFLRSFTKSATLASGLISDTDANLSFFSDSSAVREEASLKFSGPWSILRMYLSPVTYLSPEDHISYSALQIQDDAGITYVLWCGFVFNKTIPLPADWPSVHNCPKFSSFQSTTPQTLSKTAFLQRVLKVPENENGLKELENILRTYRITEKFNIRLSPLPFKAGSETGKIYAEYPYVEVQTISRQSTIFLTDPEPGCIPLSFSDGSMKFRFFRYPSDRTPALEYIVPGPYPILRLMTLKGRKQAANALQIVLPVPKPGSKETVQVPFLISF